MMTAPYGLEVEGWQEILSRKLHMGEYRGRLFSIRAMLNDKEAAECCELADRATDVRSNVRVQFEVADDSEALLFPAIYRNRGYFAMVTS